MTFEPIILIHLSAALMALMVGASMLAREKGTVLHRRSGRVWVALMLVTVLLSFGIRSSGHFSWIHLLSLWTLFAIAMALWALRRREIEAHRRWMRGCYIGPAAAGVFTLLPQRRLGHLVWHAIGLI